MTDKEVSLPELQPVDTAQSAGNILRNARKSYDISIDEVARSLNLGTEAIKALEKDKYDQLPGSTFVKGYIRSYANLLDLDPEGVLAKVELEPEKPIQIPSSRGAIRIKHNTSKKRGKSRKGGLFFKTLIVLILLAGLTLFGLNQLSNMDKGKVADFLKLPAPKNASSTGGDGNEIIFPELNSTETGAGEKKEALIQIE